MKSKKNYLIPLMICILVMQFIVYLKIQRTYKSDELVIKHQYEVVDNSEPLLVADSLKKLLSNYNVKFKDVVFFQAQVESGNFKSKLFKENNNLFGMKLAKQRPTLAIGEVNGYAYYNSWQESLFDYLMYQAKYFKGIKTEQQYIQRLNELGYSETKNYLKWK